MQSQGRGLDIPQGDELQEQIRPYSLTEAITTAQQRHQATRAKKRERLELRDAGLYYRALHQKWVREWATLFKTRESLENGNPFLFKLLNKRILSIRNIGCKINWKFDAAQQTDRDCGTQPRFRRSRAASASS